MRKSWMRSGSCHTMILYMTYSRCYKQYIDIDIVYACMAFAPYIPRRLPKSSNVSARSQLRIFQLGVFVYTLIYIMSLSFSNISTCVCLLVWIYIYIVSHDVLWIILFFTAGAAACTARAKSHHLRGHLRTE
jgi:hypothetical protein